MKFDKEFVNLKRMLDWSNLCYHDRNQDGTMQKIPNNTLILNKRTWFG